MNNQFEGMIWGTIMAFVCKDWRKSQKASLRIEIWHTPSTDQMFTAWPEGPEVWVSACSAALLG
jgi:hypothetical protein